MKLWLRMIPCWLFAGWLMGGCALMNDGAAKKQPSNMIATPPSYYSTAKGRYLGTKYRENLDRITEKIVRNPVTSQLQFANNISSVGGIGFFTHSATKTPDERYLEVVLATPETFETKGDYSDKVQKLFSRYGEDLLSILAADVDIFQDNDLAGYGLNLNWRTVSEEGQGSRVSMARAVVYFHKDRVQSYLRRSIKQNELLGDAVIFAVEDEGPLQLVSYQPREVKPDFRPAIQEDDLAVGTPAKSAATGRPESSKKSEPPPTRKTAPAKKGGPVAQKSAEPKTPADMAMVAQPRATAPVEPLPMEAANARKPDAPPIVTPAPAKRQAQSAPLVLPNPPLRAEIVKPVPEIVLPMTSSAKPSAPIVENVEKEEEASLPVPVESTNDVAPNGAANKPEVASRSPGRHPSSPGSNVAQTSKPAEASRPVKEDAVLRQGTVPEQTNTSNITAHSVLPAETNASPEPEQKIAASPPANPVVETGKAAVQPLATAERSKPEGIGATSSTQPTKESATPRTETVPSKTTRMAAPAETAAVAAPRTPALSEKPGGTAPNVSEAAFAEPISDKPAPLAAPDPRSHGGVSRSQPSRAPVQQVESRQAAKSEIALLPRQSSADVAITPARREAVQPAAERRTKEVPPLPSAPSVAPAPGLLEKPAAEQLALVRNPVEPAVTRTPAVQPTPKPLHGFIIQVAFQDRTKAQSWAEKMTRRGYAVSLTEAGPEGALRVRLGNFTVRDDAERELQSFKREGMSGIILNLPQAFRPAAQSTLP